MNSWSCITHFISSWKFPFLLILLGIALRFANYISNHSLWLDEAWLANDVLLRTFKEIIFNNLSHDSPPAIPPVGFLLIEKIFVNFLGNNEFFFRLFPFLCGILALVLYWILLKKWTGQLTALLALSFFVFIGDLIYYSAQCKQYSGEVFVAIMLYLAADYFQKKPASGRRICVFALIGMIGMFISHTAVFILGGIAITQAIFLFKSDERKIKTGYLFTYMGWAACFVLIYVVYLRVMVDRAQPMGQFCISSSSMHMMPRDGIFSRVGWAWLWMSISDFFRYPLGISPIFLAKSMLILGGFGIFKAHKKKFLMLALPFLLMIVASGLQEFPFSGRFVLFLVPAAILFIAEGISMILSRGKIGIILGLIIFLMLIAQPLQSIMANAKNAQGQEDMRPLVGLLFKDQFPGDALYMNNSAQDAYNYYLKYYHFDLSPYVNGYFLDNSEQNRITLIVNAMPAHRIYLSEYIYRTDEVLNRGKHLIHQRTWLVLTHLNKDTEEFIKDCFDDRGKMLLNVKRPGASLYLYELNEPISQI